MTNNSWIDEVLDWNDHTLPYDEQRARAKALIEAKVRQERADQFWVEEVKAVISSLK